MILGPMVDYTSVEYTARFFFPFFFLFPFPSRGSQTPDLPLRGVESGLTGTRVTVPDARGLLFVCLPFCSEHPLPGHSLSPLEVNVSLPNLSIFQRGIYMNKPTPIFRVGREEPVRPGNLTAQIMPRQTVTVFLTPGI